MGKILLCSRMRTPDGTLLVSRHVHDYQTHVDRNGETYMLDGGCEYQRMSMNNVPMTDESVYLDSPFEVIRENVTRGTFDKNGNRIWKKVSEMSDEHLRNCIAYNIDNGCKVDNVSNIVYMEELKYRLLNGITIEDDFGKEDIEDGGDNQEEQ